MRKEKKRDRKRRGEKRRGKRSAVSWNDGVRWRRGGSSQSWKPKVVEVVKMGGSGVRDCFLKDASRRALVASRGGGRGEGRRRGLRKETTTVGRWATHQGYRRRKDSRGGERIERRKEWVRIELILFHGPALLPFTAVQLLTGQLATTPFAFPTPCYLFTSRRIYVGAHERRPASAFNTHSRRFTRVSPLLVILRFWRHFFRHWLRMSVSISQR